MRRATRQIVLLSTLMLACGSELGGREAASDARAELDSAAPPDAIEIADAVDTADSLDDAHDDTPDPRDAAEHDGTDGEDARDADGAPDALDTSDVPDDASETSDTDSDDALDVPAPWRSALYPADWQAGLEDPSGAALQDYSYAGYHNGERALGDGLGPGGSASLERFDVTDFGAIPVTDPALAADSTAPFQAAIDAATLAGGGLVWVPAGIYRIDAWLDVNASRIVIKGEGPTASRLWFTRRLGLSFSAHLRFSGAEAVQHELPIVRAADRFDDAVAVDDASALNVGEDIVIGHMFTDAFLAAHGMSELWAGARDTWQPLYRRTIAGIDRISEPNLVRLDVPLRAPLDLATGPTVQRVSGLLREVGLEDIGIANATDWQTAWGGDQINAVAFTAVTDAWVQNVASWPSPGAPTSGMGTDAHLQSNGLLVASSKRVTIADCRFEKAQHRGFGGNGYLFEVRQSNEVLTRDSIAREGRNNFVQSRGFGTSGCVWLRVQSYDGASVPLGPSNDVEVPARGELHSLGTANLIDSSRFADGFDARNRDEALSYGLGHSATECVFWNFTGPEIISLQYALGYVIGSAHGTRVTTSLRLAGAVATEPEDWVEGFGLADTLVPGSLYEDQLERRLGKTPPR